MTTPSIPKVDRNAALLRAFSSSVEASRRAQLEQNPAFATALAAHVEGAAAAWKGVSLDAEVYARHAALCLGPEPDPLEALAALRGPDLYLACACAQGKSAAITAFEATHFEEIDRIMASRRIRVPKDDVCQSLREKLFVGAPGSAPKIGEYTGRGSLRNWFRTVALRALLNAATRAPRDAPSDEEACESLLASSDPEFSYMKARYAEQFKRALRTGFAELSARDKNVLSYRLVSGLSVDAIGAIYGVHRTSVARWFSEAKEALRHHVERALSAELHLNPGEMESMLRLIVSQIDLHMLDPEK